MDGVEADVDDEAVPRAPLDAREGLAVLVAEGRLDQLLFESSNRGSPAS